MPAVRVRIPEVKITATVRTRTRTFLTVPAFDVDVSLDVDRATGAPTISAAVPVGLDMSGFEEVRNKRFGWNIADQGNPGDTAVGAMRFDVTELAARLEVALERAWDPSECRGKTGGQPPRPLAKPDFRAVGRCVVRFRYQQTNELFQYRGRWVYLKDQVVESGARTIEGGWSVRPVFVGGYEVDCLLPPKGAPYSRYELLGEPIFVRTLA